MMIMELAARGDLKSFLRDCRPISSNEPLLTEYELAKMGVDIASGLEFLSSRGFVHRDVAARLEFMRKSEFAEFCRNPETVLSPPI